MSLSIPGYLDPFARLAADFERFRIETDNALAAQTPERRTEVSNLVRNFGFSPAGALRHLDWHDGVVHKLIHGVGGEEPTGIFKCLQPGIFERLQPVMKAELRRLDLIKVANAAIRRGYSLHQSRQHRQQVAPLLTWPWIGPRFGEAENLQAEADELGDALRRRGLR